MFLAIVLLYLTCLSRQGICKTCSYNLSNSAGTIDTWDYESLDQYVGSTCEWVINVAEQTIMSIKIDKFDWKDCFESNCCKNAPVQIWAGGQILAEYCKYVFSDALSIRDTPIVVKWDLRGVLVLFRIKFFSRTSVACPNHHFECTDRRRCYNTSEYCDQYPDCFDHSDEENCSPLCQTDHVPCLSASIECFHPVHQRCDGVMDCPNGEDELSCGDNCPGEFSCGNSTAGCFDLRRRCDGRKDCESGIDEANCTTTTCNSFVCDNGNCIDDVLVNNGLDDCGDGSDENKRNSPKTSIMVAILVCGMILTIGFIVLMYRWKHTRRDIRQLLANLPQIPLPPFEGPGERDDNVVYDIQFSESDYMRGGKTFFLY